MEQQIYGDRYQLIDKIGTGGMAEVYKALDTVLDRQVAIKVLHRHFAEDVDFVSRFRREAQAAASLNHPNIVNIYDWGSQNGTYFIVMELLNGQSLKQYIHEKGVIPPAEAMEIAKKVLSALGFAHKHEIIHRDIKPHNIILNNEGDVKVTDFGIARAGTSTMTQTGTILGTAHYLSPEQARGHDVGVTSDIYSMGIVLYEMLTGRVPFDGENPVAIALKHVHDIPVPPREYVPDIPPALQTIIAKSMAKNPENRYHSAGEMKNDIMRAAQGMPVNAIAPDEQETMVMAPQKKPANKTTVSKPAYERQEFSEQPSYREPVIEMQKNRWPLILFIFLLVATTVIGGTWFAINSGIINTTQMVAVPNVQQIPYEEAERILRNKGLKIKRAGQAFSNTLNAGLVISQDPSPNDKLEEGKPVAVIISKGQDLRAVPDVAGDRESKATASLIGEGFDVGDSSYEYSDEIQEGMVIRTEPAAAEEVPKGTKVNLVISKGPSSIQIPDVTGKSAAESEASLKEVGFVVTTSEEYSDTIQKGGVTRTLPPGGNQATKGASITVYTSKGPEMVSVPNVLNKLEDEAKDILINDGFTVKIVTIDNVSPENDSKVLSQEPSAGEKLPKKNATITLSIGRAIQ